MEKRIRLLDFMLSDGPRQIGVSAGDVVSCAQAVNAASERLRYDEVFGDEGPSGSYAEVAISVPDTAAGYVTCPRGIEGLMAIDVCKTPIPLSNQFQEYLLFGSGHLPKCDRWNGLVGRWRGTAGVTRNYAVTFSDLPGPSQIMIVPENVNDCVPNPQTGAVARVLVQGTSNGIPVVTQDGPNTVQGEYVMVTQPYVLTKNTFDGPSLTGMQKDVTLGNIQIWASNPFWGTSVLISYMEPSETVAWYRRYFINRLPPSCCRFKACCQPSPVNGIIPSPPCPSPNPPLIPERAEITALARLEIIPVTVPTDYLFIQSLEALKLECMAGYMYGMQYEGSKKQAEEYHRRAVKILIGQSYAEDGKNQVASNFAPFGAADWCRVNLNMT